MRVAQRVERNGAEREKLEPWARARSLPARMVERAPIISRAADGLPDKEIAAELGLAKENAFCKEQRSFCRVNDLEPGRIRHVAKNREKESMHGFWATPAPGRVK